MLADDFDAGRVRVGSDGAATGARQDDAGTFLHVLGDVGVVEELRVEHQAKDLEGAALDGDFRFVMES